MKHLKQYESTLEKYYWLLPTDYRFENALRKIGWVKVDLPHNPDFLTNVSIKAEKYVYIGTIPATNYWGWMNFNESIDITPDNIKCDFYENNEYKFQGIVDIPELELELDANKYNL